MPEEHRGKSAIVWHWVIVALKLVFLQQVAPVVCDFQSYSSSKGNIRSLGLEYGQEVNSEHKFKKSPKSRTL